MNESVEQRRATGEPVLHLGFGGVGLPVPPEVAEALGRAASRNSYAPVAGTPPARAAAARWFVRRGVPTDAEQIVFAPGSKPLLYALLACLPGDVVLCQPSWVSYAAQATLTGKRVLSVPTPASAGGVPDPDLLTDALLRARRTGHSPGVLVLTLPDNPTGTIAEPALVERVCQIAAEHDLTIVSDEIYRDLAYEPSVHPSPARLAPERCFVTSGLSKSLALGGWRVGFARFPHGVLGDRTRRDVLGLASEVWSSLADPMQEVAALVLDEPPEVVDHVNASRRLHRAVTMRAHDELVAVGVSCRRPQAAFYLYPDMGPHRETLARQGITTGAELATHLLERHGVGVLAGEAFGDDPVALRFRVATSLLYGRSDAERWTALHSGDPLSLPWIAEALDTLRTTLRAVVGRQGPDGDSRRWRLGATTARIG